MKNRLPLDWPPGSGRTGGRLISLDRAEAEFIIEAIERDGGLLFAPLAADLRKQWGMSPKESDLLQEKPRE